MSRDDLGIKPAQSKRDVTLKYMKKCDSWFVLREETHEERERVIAFDNIREAMRFRRHWRTLQGLDPETGKPSKWAKVKKAA